MDPAVWLEDRSDGAEYNVYVRSLAEPHTLRRVYSRTLDPGHRPEDRRWFDARVDLSPYGGQAVELVFEVLPGSAGDASYDWGGWSSPQLVYASRDGTSQAEEVPGLTRKR
jgi:hypothetical protein